jgi:IclR family KDG regulon transcriptional repressor
MIAGAGVSGRAEGDAGSRSVRRALDIFELMLAADEPLPISQLVARLAIPKSTAYELVRTLTEAQYLERAEKGGLFLGRKLFELGMAYKSHIDLAREGSRVVEELRDLTGETVQLSVLENDMMLVLVKEEGSMPIRIVSRVGSRVPVNWAASGRLLVSDLQDEPLRALLGRGVCQSPSGAATMEIDTLIEQVRAARAQGYAHELNEANAHAGCVAAPVLDSRGRCVATLSIVAPEQRLGPANRDRLIEAVTAAGKRLSQRLGGERQD